MIYLTPPSADPTAPLLLLHLPSLTLASLTLSALPDGSHLLSVASDSPPPNEAFQEFAATLESMAPGASDHLTMITHEILRYELPEFIPFAPAVVSHPYPLLIFSPRHRFAHVPQAHSPLHIWQHPAPSTARQRTLNALATAFTENFLTTLHPTPTRQ